MENIKDEIDALKIKLPSSNRLNTLYQGTGQEIDSLSHQIYLKDCTISDLEARLGGYEGTCMKEETEEAVAFRPGNLKQRLSDRPTETHVGHQSKTNKLEIDWPLQRAWEIEQNTSGIAGKQPLQKEFKRRTTEGQWTTRDEQDLFCSSLEEDQPNQLRAQLVATITVCQELLKRLERKRQGDGSTDKVTLDLQFEEFSDNSKAAHLNTLVSRLKEENRELKQRIAHVVKLNTEWQKYDLSREEYVKGLCKRLKESNPMAGLRVGMGAGVEPEPVSNTLLQQEIMRLNHLLDEKMKDCAKLCMELQDSRKEDQERIQTLEQQALIYAEDFKSERADRERTQSRVQDLQDEVLRLQMKLRKKQERRDPPAACWMRIGHRMSAHMHVDAAEPLMTNTDQPGLQQGLTDLQCPRR